MSRDGLDAQLVRLWTDQLAAALLTMSGEQPGIQSDPGSPAEAGVRWTQYDFSLGPDASLWVGAAEAVRNQIGAKILNSAGIETPEPADVQNTYLEVLSQAAGALAARLTEASRKEVTCRSGAEPPGQPPDSEFHRVTLAFAGGEPLAVYAGFSPQLLEAAAGPAVAPRQMDGPQQAPGQALTSKTLDVLLDVEVPVRVSFGSAHIRVQEVLKLTTGSIVELDRSISDLVEVVVNNCVIARGEVVVIEGNYGVQIKEIASRSERLRTSRESMISMRTPRSDTP